MFSNTRIKSYLPMPLGLPIPRHPKSYTGFHDSLRHCDVCKICLPRKRSTKLKRELCRKHSFQVVMLMKCRNITLESAIEIAKSKI